MVVFGAIYNQLEKVKIHFSIFLHMLLFQKRNHTVLTSFPSQNIGIHILYTLYLYELHMATSRRDVNSSCSQIIW